MSPDDTFREWSKYILMEIERHSTELKEARDKCEKCRTAMNKEFSQVKNKISILTVKVTLICTALTLVITLAAKYFLK